MPGSRYTQELHFTTDRYERLTRSCCDGTDKIYQVFVATVMCYAHCGRDRQELSALRRNRDRQRVVVDLQVYMYALGVRVCHTSCRVYVSLRSCCGVGHMLGDTIAVYNIMLCN